MKRSTWITIVILGLPAAAIVWISVTGLPRWLGQQIGRSLGIVDVASIESVKLAFAAPWAQGRPALVIFACAAAAAIGVWFYVRFQRDADRRARVTLGILRAMALALFVTVLAEPAVSLTLIEQPRPLLVLLFDGTDSMNLKDKLPADDVASLAREVRLDDNEKLSALTDASRLDLVGRAIEGPQSKAFDDLLKRVRVRAYLMSRVDGLRELDVAGDGSSDTIDVRRLADSLRADGQVTAIGAALDEVARRHRGHLLAGVAVFSDFDQNAGVPALPVAERLGAPVYTIGVGPSRVVDLAVDLQAPLVLKKDERTSVTAQLRQTGLTGSVARLRLTARRLGTAGDDIAEKPFSLAPARQVELDSERKAMEIPFTPPMTGRFLLEVRADPFDGEALVDNNAAHRETTVRDESLHLFFVEYEPTWEWRFIKEVFHRDPLVGRDGFRTFLRSADFKVRRTNDLFVETLVQPRSEFFAHDVIFLSDVPGDVLSDSFQQMLREYVEKFGGGLVVIAGPRFGVGSLASTSIADMLPVVVDPAQRPRAAPFQMRLSARSSDVDFMQLGDSETESRSAWANMGALPWYQPVVRPHPLATVLAEHPTDRCVDNQTPQPIIAMRRFGKGEVIYLGFNETWRLRRQYGEKYYRQFWGRMIYRLGLGRALGSQKRFLPAVDRPTYQAGDKVRITVEAYDPDFAPLEHEALKARLIVDRPAARGVATVGSTEPLVTDLAIPLARDRVIYEAVVPVYTAGAYRLLVKDPVTGNEEEVNFTVAPVSAERRNAVRDTELQHALASQTGGHSYELYDWSRLVRDLRVPTVEEPSERHRPLWNTWAMLCVVIAVMMTEWAVRKLMNMR